MSSPCQVDFYQLAGPERGAEQLACKLAMMAWERGHRVAIIGRDAAQVQDLDRLLWQTPEGRFLPHEQGTDHPAPVSLLMEPPGENGDVVINLTDRPLPAPRPWRRLLEIVPFHDEDRAAARDKFRAYRADGHDPKAHQIN
ncbi:MAG: DNA polymerase III subunit chi [Pseudomonadota bacterium]